MIEPFGINEIDKELVEWIDFMNRRIASYFAPSHLMIAPIDLEPMTKVMREVSESGRGRVEIKYVGEVDIDGVAWWHGTPGRYGRHSNERATDRMRRVARRLRGRGRYARRYARGKR